MVKRPLAASYWCPARMRSASAWTTVKVDTFMLGKGKPLLAADLCYEDSLTDDSEL